jgi:hypothetical protein
MQAPPARPLRPAARPPDGPVLWDANPALHQRWVTKSPGQTPFNSALAGAESGDSSADSPIGARTAHGGPNAEFVLREPWMGAPQKACKPATTLR